MTALETSGDCDPSLMSERTVMTGVRSRRFSVGFSSGVS
jgi:hypothetical protein